MKKFGTFCFLFASAFCVAQTGDLIVTSPAFDNEDFIPYKHTGYAADISPEFNLENLSEKAVSIAIIMDDLDVPFAKEYNHWTIWNIPATEKIPENIPYGETVESLGGAKQGRGYGKNRYAGPNIPQFMKKAHRYVFTIYVLDSFIELDSKYGKKELLKAMEGHILQQGKITGLCRRRENL